MSDLALCQHHCCKWPNTVHSHYLDPEECNACSLILHDLALAKNKVDEAEDQLAQVIQEQKQRAHDSMMIDRTGWTEAEWIEDAVRLMNEPFGAITSLVNGHAMRLIDYYQRTSSASEDLLAAADDLDRLEELEPRPGRVGLGNRLRRMARGNGE